MTYRGFRRGVLELAAVGQERLTLALVVLELSLDAGRSRRWLDRMVDDGLLELSSLDDGTLYYFAPGLHGGGRRGEEGPRGAVVVAGRSARRPALRRRPALLVAGILSVMDLVCVGLAALIVHPAWEAEVLMWIALGGAPGTLGLIAWGSYRLAVRVSGR